MTCGEYEPLIALYVDDDLDDASGVQRHLKECAACSGLLEDLQASQAALKELAGELVDPALLHEVRSGVLAKIGGRRRLVWPWVAALAAGAALFALLTPSPPNPAPVAQFRANPVKVEPVRAVERPAAVPVRRRKRKRVVKPEPLVVKMLTGDPDVVIIWLVDQTGD